MKINHYVCKNCGYIGKCKQKARGSILIEIFLWLWLFVPGLLYSLWRLSTKTKVCPSCESPNIIPSLTPVGKKLLKDIELNKALERQKEAELSVLIHSLESKPKPQPKPKLRNISFPEEQ